MLSTLSISCRLRSNLRIPTIKTLRVRLKHCHWLESYLSSLYTGSFKLIGAFVHPSSYILIEGKRVFKNDSDFDLHEPKF